ncbi:glutamate racemase [Olivibacter sitiensis]|uniref:glutamate racemase n=1 Tax=Olivibacter sitiensis TaxID=376470 RepID=UPI0004290A0F|nr:glutamate racemase [Olivibacter sitiensis]
MGPIGIFDSGYGGLTVFREIARTLPQYDYIYLGDNARVPYGTRSFETVYQYTKECTEELFRLGCRLVILACNTASAKALRTIQQIDLPQYSELRKVLGVIRPTTERIGDFTQSKAVGILATAGTVHSNSYVIECQKFFPDIRVYQQACPMWVPLVENNELNNPGARYFVQKSIDALLQQNPAIDLFVLACTHYPLLQDTIRDLAPPAINILTQGELVAESLKDYLVRHPEVEPLCSKNGTQQFYSTETPDNFNSKAALFFGKPVHAEQLPLPFCAISPDH